MTLRFWTFQGWFWIEIGTIIINFYTSSTINEDLNLLHIYSVKIYCTIFNGTVQSKTWRIQYYYRINYYCGRPLENPLSNTQCNTHLIYISEPLCDVVECLCVGDIVNEHDPHGSSVIRCGDRMEPLLACGVPV